MQHWSELDVRSRWRIIAPDSVSYEITLRVGSENLRTGRTEGRYELWPLNAEQRNGSRIKRQLGLALLKTPAMQGKVTEALLARITQGPMGVLHWCYDATTGERTVWENTMPAWWSEPANREALCHAWEAQGHGNPLPEGWGEEPCPLPIAAE